MFTHQTETNGILKKHTNLINKRFFDFDYQTNIISSFSNIKLFLENVLMTIINCNDVDHTLLIICLTKTNFDFSHLPITTIWPANHEYSDFRAEKIMSHLTNTQYLDIFWSILHYNLNNLTPAILLTIFNLNKTGFKHIQHFNIVQHSIQYLVVYFYFFISVCKSPTL